SSEHIDSGFRSVREGLDRLSQDSPGSSGVVKAAATGDQRPLAVAHRAAGQLQLGRPTDERRVRAKRERTTDERQVRAKRGRPTDERRVRAKRKRTTDEPTAICRGVRRGMLCAANGLS